MHKIEFKINGKSIIKKTPANWNEFTLDQALFVVPRVMLVNKSLRLRRELLYRFLGLAPKVLEEMNTSQESALFEIVDWMFKQPTLTRNLIPKLKTGLEILYGPDADCKNISVSQFAFADKFLGEFLKQKEEGSLNMLISTLYTYSNKPFRKEDIEMICNHVRGVALDQKLVILAFFIGCRQKLAHSHKDIFKKTNKVRRSRSGWLGFFYEMAGPKTGTYSEVANMNFFEMLGMMRKINDDAAEMEKKNKRRR